MAANMLHFVICFHVALVAVGLGLVYPSKGEVSASDLTFNTNHVKCRFKNSSHGLVINCAHLRLSDVPQGLPPEVTALDLSFNNLTVLRNESFEDVPNLGVLNCQNNPLTFIESTALWPLTRLRILRLANCNLVKLSPTLFVKNILITQLLLPHNQLVTIPCKAFAALPRLSGIYLGHNKIQSLNFDGCSGWAHWSIIDLSLNEVSEIHKSNFLPLQNMTISKLSLRSNRIQTLTAEAFSHLTSVQSLTLQSNLIKSFDIQPFLGMAFIKKLSLYGGKINQLLPPSNATQKHYPSILNLDMTFNWIESVPPDSFWGFTKLRTLRLAGNKISTLTNRSFCMLQSLVELDISDNRIKSLPPEMFACLLSLTKLNISKNSLQTISPVSFNNMPSILSVFLSHNAITDFNGKRELWTLGTLQVMDISYNDIKAIARRRFSGLTNLLELNASYNQICTYTTDAFADLVKLERLHLSNEKSTFLEETFTQLQTLVFLDLSNTLIKVSKDSVEQYKNMTGLQELQMETAQLRGTDLYDTVKNQSLFTGLHSLKKLRLKNNFLGSLDERVFHNRSKLSYLDMTNSRIQVLRSGLFSPLISLKFLFLNDNALLEIPRDIFRGLYHLFVVNIPNNNLRGLDPTLFSQNPRLAHLYLPGNQISNINPGTILPSNTSLNLDVSRNPFTCSCSLTWFRQWLESANVKFKHADQTLCSPTSLKGFANQPILSFHPEDHCGVNIVLIVVLSFSGVLVGMMSVLAYNKRWWLNHKLFLLKLAVLGYEEMAEEFNVANYNHHLNLMFDEAEEEWVDQVMKPGLEERLPHLQNIIFGDKDLHLGMYYINALYDAIDNSFKTVLLLSNQSVNDAWTMTKLRMALEHLNDTGMDKVILIFVEEIEDDHLPYLVRLFLSRNKPHMLWTDDEDGQELFWAQFKKGMRANKAINNLFPL